MIDKFLLACLVVLSLVGAIVAGSLIAYGLGGIT